MEEFRILRGQRIAASPELQENQHWPLQGPAWKNPMRYSPGEKRGSEELTAIQALPPPSLSMIHAAEQESKQRWQEDEQRTPGKIRCKK